MNNDPDEAREAPSPDPAASADHREGDDTLEEDSVLRDHPRFEQMFPVLSDTEVERVCRFGKLRHYPAGDFLYRAGSLCPGVFVILSGQVRIIIRDRLNRRKIIHTYSRHGEFTSDITQLSNKPAIVDAQVIEEVKAVLLRPDELSALVIKEADIGEKIMRALILRRVVAVERGRGAVIVGAPGNARFLELQNFLRRNNYPNVALDAEQDADAIAFLKRLAPQPDDFPLVVCPSGTVLRNPDVGQLASCLGLIPEFDPKHVYDVAIIGAGPAGLAAAVYAASDGLSVAVFDCRAPGGQAGTSARIENYLGFPTGITGQELAGRAFVQAQKFGAHIAIPCEVKALYCDKYPRVLELSDGKRILARTAVIATGAEYRRPVLDGLERFEGSGVYYWATPVEARLCRKEPVVLVGGGNSAGQAAVFLSSHAEHVHLFIRGPSLEQTMSRYLVERVRSLPNLTLHTRIELQGLEGDVQLRRVHYRGAGGTEGSMTTRHLFVFIGAEPNTGWLKSCGVSLDSKGFVLTGTDTAAVQTLPLQTSVKGVFAIGDVRSASTKRVAAAVGEGAAVVAQIHSLLAEERSMVHPGPA
ncbi:FAD-dependent oxidoreductase [Cupriavidus sp. P-10]|uniref:FAD-dependent oxidoreductase n=1 Tax=Cupriavidus sp. P-10 TaxID=2027911 RepID=UPI000E2E5633|nr:FAD-dependent oxidoreductase [Cupriavidus sp. P-10]BDB28382.1 FAD-dependent oxidoreductase [Cupriavidus sp. P-10]